MEGFSVHAEGGGERIYVEDVDLTHKVRKALDSGTRQAVVLLQLGIDDDSNEATVDGYRGPFGVTRWRCSSSPSRLSRCSASWRAKARGERLS